MDSLTFSDQLDHFDFERVTQWLSTSYWSPGIPQAKVEKGARHSTVAAAAFIDGQQVAFARVMSDTTRFAYLADVVVDESYRRRGIATALVNYLLQHPILNEVEHWYLITQDAMAVYEPLGFAPFNNPNRTIMVKHSR